MDRLVAGDVGYGKTEVALRAAFKAVADGAQVAVLVPTTVLAQQHWSTFTDRFGAFPAKVELLSRFRSPAELKAVIAGLAAGTVDVVIGTHRSSPIRGFPEPGLLVVDEATGSAWPTREDPGPAGRRHLLACRDHDPTAALTSPPACVHVGHEPPRWRLPVRPWGAVRPSVIKRLSSVSLRGRLFFATIASIAASMRASPGSWGLRIVVGRAMRSGAEETM